MDAGEKWSESCVEAPTADHLPMSAPAGICSSTRTAMSVKSPLMAQTKDQLDTFDLLNFPSKSKGLSKYKPRLRASDAAPSYEPETQESLRSGSPPRKTARLEGDSDYTSSYNKRMSDKGKGKQRADNVTGVDLRDGVKKIPAPMPVRTPWVSIKDQYWVEMLIRNMPST